MHDAPEAEVEGDEGLDGLLVEHGSEVAVGAQIVVKAVCKGVDGQSQSERCVGEDQTFLSHDALPILDGFGRRGGVDEYVDDGTYRLSV